MVGGFIRELQNTSCLKAMNSFQAIVPLYFVSQKVFKVLSTFPIQNSSNTFQFLRGTTSLFLT